MVSEAQMPLCPELGGNGQWGMGMGVGNVDKGPAASPAADTTCRPGHSSGQGSPSQLWLLLGQ